MLAGGAKARTTNGGGAKARTANGVEFTVEFTDGPLRACCWGLGK